MTAVNKIEIMSSIFAILNQLDGLYLFSHILIPFKWIVRE